MFGNYHIQQGIYKFSLQEVIRKDFIIKEGSTITFNGPPLDATLDIQASYTVPSASLNDLIPDASTIIQQPNEWHSSTPYHKIRNRVTKRT